MTGTTGSNKTGTYTEIILKVANGNFFLFYLTHASHLTNHMHMGVLFRVRETIKFRIFRPFLLFVGKAIGRFSTVGDHPIFDNRNFEWTRLLEQNWKAIRAEVELLIPRRESLPSLQDIQQEQKVLNQDANWKTFFLFGFGVKATLNCRACPVTTSMLEKIPGMKTAFFSILSPNKHIPAHKGIYKGIIRSHLGLIIPGKPGDCVMRVDDQQIQWQEGKVVVFDDTYDHEVWNNSNEVRVVLLVDTVRPFRGPLYLLNNSIINLIGNSSYTREAKKSHDAWEQEFYNSNANPQAINESFV